MLYDLLEWKSQLPSVVDSSSELFKIINYKLYKSCPHLNDVKKFPFLSCVLTFYKLSVEEYKQKELPENLKLYSFL